jgi:hypothetical protein
MTLLISTASKIPRFTVFGYLQCSLNHRQSFTVKNIGSSAKQYTLTHVPAGTAITVTPVSSVLHLTRL